ncbi:hypothetical protein [Aeromonas hydrophila]|uniref:hypothetical protein n=1 Tax=Aeromonas hydrophila TaxID=644 RepID=UPI00114D2D32|nr:hypothetical protein [Aeromonas hydrophila]
MSDISSISNASLSASYTGSTSSANAQPAEQRHHRHHDGGEKMMGDVTSALSSLGVNLDTSSSGTKSALSSFMNTLMGTMQGSRGGKADSDNDGDEQTGAAQSVRPQPGADRNPLKQGLDTLIASLQDGSNSDPALGKLQDQFNTLMGTTGQGNNKVSLQNFLGAFDNQLTHETPSNGYMVNTSA